jgi:hypothetical protein
LTSTGAGTVPHVTPFAPEHTKLNVLLFIPVLVTAKVSLYPPVFWKRCGAVPPSGVTATLLASRTFTIHVPWSEPPLPVTVNTIVAVPGVPVVLNVTGQFALVVFVIDEPRVMTQFVIGPEQEIENEYVRVVSRFVARKMTCWPVEFTNLFTVPEGPPSGVTMGDCATTALGTPHASTALSIVAKTRARVFMGRGWGC